MVELALLNRINIVSFRYEKSRLIHCALLLIPVFHTVYAKTQNLTLWFFAKAMH